MNRIRKYDIAFSGLKNGKHSFEFEIDKKFFDLFEADVEFETPKILAKILLDKHSTFLDFTIDVEGSVDLYCDISGGIFTYPIDNEIKVLVKFGESYDDSNDEVITIPMSDYEFNVSQLIYEATLLSIPMKKISPEVENHPEYKELLEKYSPVFEEDLDLDQFSEEEDEEIDPRWAALKKLKDKD